MSDDREQVGVLQAELGVLADELLEARDHLGSTVYDVPGVLQELSDRCRRLAALRAP